MMGPDYTHWHGMYEVAKHFYTHFLPEVLELAERKGQGRKWRARIDEMMRQEQHMWQKGLTPEEAKALERSYRQRYGEKR